MTGTEKPAQIFLPTTGIGGSVIITNTLKIDTANLKDTTIQLTIVNLKQSTIPRHSDRNHFPIYSLNSFIEVTIFGQNVDNRNGMNPEGPIVATFPNYNIANNCNIFDLVIKTLDIYYRVSLWHGTIRI